MNCRVYWGHSGCDLPPGHNPDQDIRTHCQDDQAVTVEDAYLYGEDLTEAETQRRDELW